MSSSSLLLLLVVVVDVLLNNSLMNLLNMREGERERETHFLFFPIYYQQRLRQRLINIPKYTDRSQIRAI